MARKYLPRISNSYMEEFINNINAKNRKSIVVLGLVLFLVYVSLISASFLLVTNAGATDGHCRRGDERCRPTPTPKVCKPTPTNTPAITPTQEPTATPSATPQPTPMPTPTTTAVSNNVSNSGETGVVSGAFQCDKPDITIKPINAHLYRFPDYVIIKYQPTAGNAVNVYYDVNGIEHMTNAVRSENDGYIEVHSLNVNKGYTFDIQQADGCSGGVKVRIVDPPSNGKIFTAIY